MRLATSLLCAVLCAIASFAQRRVDTNDLHERVIAVVPIVGKGTFDDPKRPLFASENAKDYQRSTAIREFRWQPSDDWKVAIVEFVATNRQALIPVLRESRALKAFEKGKQKHDEIEKELRKYRKDFRLDHFRGRGK